MGIFSWDGESEDVASDTTDNAIAQLGLDALIEPAQPEQPSQPEQPLTRRELRERERAAELRATAEAIKASPFAAPAPPASVPLATPVPTTVVPVSTVAPVPSTAPIATPNAVAPSNAVVPSTVMPPSTAMPPSTPTAASNVEQIFLSTVTETFAQVTSVTSAKASKKSRGPRIPRRGRKRTPVIVDAGAAAASRPVVQRASRRPSLRRRILGKLMSLGAMAGAALMLVATSLPANAFLPAEAATMTVADQSEIAAAPVAAEAQSLKATATAAAPVLSRDGYTAVSLREQIFLKYGNRNFAYTANASGAIRWPFPIAVPISDGFGPRVAPCAGCSTFHEGVDFTPGAGTAIGVIADGVVVGVNSEDWTYGQHVIVDHVINGQHIQSWYAHMQVGSIRVKVGDVVKVGDELGQVGSTGHSTGAHLHLEIHVNGVPVDPFAWLKANAG